MIVAVFRSRLRPEAIAEYRVWAQRMTALAIAMPGYVSHKLFVAEDGERLMHVEFESNDALRGWGAHPDHQKAKLLGRQRFFAAYRAQVCEVLHDVTFAPAADGVVEGS
jgi:heme-degrading monooxygenase HmoA